MYKIKNVTLATTKWGDDQGGQGPARERQLSQLYRTMAGSNMARFCDTPESAWDVVDLILAKDLEKDSLILEEFVKLQDTLPSRPPKKVKRGLLGWFGSLFK